jgi:hypothetical protein
LPSSFQLTIGQLSAEEFYVRYVDDKKKVAFEFDNV